MEIKFEVDAQVAQMFDLAVSISKQDRNEVFRQLAEQYAVKTLHVMHSGLQGDNCNSSQPVSDYGEGGEGPALIRLDRESNCNRAVAKIARWSDRPDQINSQIIIAFLKCKDDDGIASLQEMKEYFLQNPGRNDPQFYSNFNSMCTDRGNSHGHVFDYNRGKVTLSCEEVKKEIGKWFEGITD